MLSVTDQNDINYYNQLAHREYKRICKLLADPDTEYNASKLGSFIDTAAYFVRYKILINDILLRGLER